MSIVITERKAVTPIRCHRCKHEWNYSGKNTFTAMCPHCRIQVNIKKHAKVNSKVPQPGQDSTQAQAAGFSISPEGDKGK